MAAMTKETLLSKMNLMSKYRLRKLAKGLGMDQQEIIKLEGDPEGSDKLIQTIINKYDNGTITSDKLESVINSVSVVTAREKKTEQTHTQEPQRIEEPMPTKQSENFDMYDYDDVPIQQEVVETPPPPPPPSASVNSEIIEMIKKQNETIAVITAELKDTKELVVELSEITKFCFARAFKMTLTKPIDGFADILKKAKEITIAKLSNK